MQKEFTYLGRLLAVICLAVLTDTCLGSFRNENTGMQSVREPAEVQSVRESAAVQGVREPAEVQGAREPAEVQSAREPIVIQVSQTPGESGKELSGTLQLAGSASMEKLSDAWAESFMEKYPNVRVTVEYIGSGGGIADRKSVV